MNVIKIPAKPQKGNAAAKEEVKRLRVAAYCRVSTDNEEQASSYEAQIQHYEEFIKTNPEWEFVGVYADEGISATNTKKREQFNTMIEDCQAGKIDMIFTKSISRFARNTLDCLKYIRLLKEINIPVFFEKESINTMDAKGEVLITIMASLAQQESESLSKNTKMGIQYRFQQGKVLVNARNFLGYDKDEEGHLVINPAEAEIVKRIFREYLEGASCMKIARGLERDGILTARGNPRWHDSTVRKILENEKYMGDALLQKTYTIDFLNKKRGKNNGTLPQYYIEDDHEAIIPKDIFMRVQEEMARRGGKRKVKQVGTKTEQGRYSSKYALTELLICGECGTPFRRCTWAANGKKKVVWRCINRLDYGKKYCHDSPSIEESVLQEAIMKAVLQTAKQNTDVLKTLKLHIGMGLSAETTEDNSLDLQIRIAEVEAEFQKMLKAIAADNVEAFDEEKAKALMDEKAKLQIQLDRIADTKQKRENAKSRLDEIFTIIEALANHPISYDDQIVRQVLESVIVESKEKIKVVFVGGLEVTQLM